MPGARRLAALGAADAAHRVLRQVHPETAVRAHAMAAMLELLSRLLGKLAAGAAAAAAAGAEGGPGPVTVAHISAAVAAVLPGELAKHAKAEMVKAAVKVASGDPSAGLQLTPELLGPALSAALAASGAGDPDAAASVAVTAALEYLCAEIWELTGSAARDRAQMAAGGGYVDTSAEPIIPDDIRGIIVNDEELAKLGVFPPPTAAAAASGGGGGLDCDEADFQWRSRDPGNDAAEFGWAAITPEEE